MIILSELALIGINVWMAWYHAELIKEDKRVRHALWGGAYAFLSVYMAWALESWWFLGIAFCLRKLVFDSALNLYRGLPLFHVSTTTTSIIDRLHYKVFKEKSEIYQALYLIKLIVMNIILW